ncbi:MAG: Bacterial regulatory protein arsR family [Clostridia bacterium]|jgi:predicted ArsR family transcriptional regulator|nr:Bacterial regulatory protein arsR family [Clostridia bacterium]
MLRSFPVIKDPIDYRIINLLNRKPLNFEDLQKILNMPPEKVRKHLNQLHRMHLISCNLTSSPEMWRISDLFIETSPLFYEACIVQMKKAQLYQDDLKRLESLNSTL